MARGRVRTHDDVAQHGAHTGQLYALQTSMQFDIGDPFYGQVYYPLRVLFTKLFEA